MADFRFVPVSPEALSGPSMLSQLEYAINELSDGSAEARAIAEEALGTARDALAEAVNASLTAEDAANQAGRADAKADRALDRLDDLEPRVEAARQRADEAFDLAAMANSAAGSAEAKADRNTAAIEVLERKVTVHSQDIVELRTTLAGLQSGGGDGAYMIAEEALDLDEHVTEAEKLYSDQPALNAPQGLAGPFFFDACPTNPVQGGYQLVRGAANPALVYARAFTAAEDNYSSGSRTLTLSAASGGPALASTDLGFDFSASGYEVTVSGTDFVASSLDSEAGASSGKLEAAALTGGPYVLSSDGVDLATADADGIWTILEQTVAYDNGSLFLFGLTTTDEGLSIGFFFEYANVYTTSFEPWKAMGGASDLTERKNEILGALTVTNPDTDIRQAVGYNGRIFAAVTLPGAPEDGPCAYEFVSDTGGHGTICQAVPIASKNLYYASTTSSVTPATGSSAYRISATSGDLEHRDTLLLTAGPDGLGLAPGVGSNFTLSEAAGAGPIALAASVAFYSDHAAFREDGFTLRIVPEGEDVLPTDGIEVVFPAYGNAEATVVRGSAEGDTSALRYQSGAQANAGGSAAEFTLSAAWTDFSGSIEWPDWVRPGFSKAIPEVSNYAVGDEVTLAASQTVVLDQDSPFTTVYQCQDGGSVEFDFPDLAAPVYKYIVLTLAGPATGSCAVDWSENIVWDQSEPPASVAAGEKLIVNLTALGGQVIGQVVFGS